MKKLFTGFTLFLMLAFLVTGVKVNAQNSSPMGISDFSISVLNMTQPTNNTIEFDVYLLDLDAADPFELASIQLGFLLNSGIYTGGTLTATYNNSGSGLSGAQQFSANTSIVTTINGYPGQTLIRLAGKTPPGAGNGTIISAVSPGTQVTHFTLTSTVPFVSGTTPNLTFVANTATNPLYGTKVAQYVGGVNTQLPVTPGVNALVCCNPVLNPPFPVAFNVTGSGSYCQGSTGTPVGLDGSEVGVTYTLYKDAVPQVPTVAGTGAAITFGDQLAGTYTVEGTNTTGTTPMTGSAVITEDTPVAVSVTIAPDQNNICEGTLVSFTATPVNGGTPSYQWYLNNAAAGADEATFNFTPANNDEVYVVMTSSLTCTTGNPATSATTTMIVNPSLPVSVTATPDANNVCLGTSVTFTATPTNGGSPAYQWYLNGVATGNDAGTFMFVPANGDEVYVVMTSNLAGCLTGNPATSSTTTMVVDDYPVSVSIAADVNPICQGSDVTFTATPVNGGNASYQWYLNGNPAGSNQATFTFTPANNDQVYVVLTSDLTCASSNPATSSTVTMTVDTPLAVSVTMSPDANNVCAGTSVLFTATPTNGGTPAYQWYVNNLPVGLNEATYSYAPANNDEVYVTMTSDLGCVSGNPATSATTTMVVNPLIPVSVTATPDQNNVCEGTSITFTAVPVNGGAPTYQWYLNGNPVGLNQDTYTFVASNNDQVYVQLTSDLTGCVTGNPAVSSTTTMVVYPPAVASVTIAPDQNNVCAGTSVTFTATPVNGGVTPSYQWYLNSNPVGSDQDTYSFVPANGDQVYVVMITSVPACITGSPATSNTTTMAVNPLLPASVTIAPDLNNVCQGTSVTFTATPVNGGTTPSYQWYRNSAPVGLNQATYTFVPNNNDQVYVVLTSNATCATGSPATSASTTMTVNPLLPVSVTIAPDQNNVCQGVSVTFTATPVNGGTPSYQWYLNGAPVGSNQNTYTLVPNNNDAVYVVMTSTATCATGNPATSATTIMSVYPPLVASVSVVADQNNVCQGTSVTFTATPVNGGATPAYQWYRNGSPVGSNQATYTVAPNNGDQVYVVMTSSISFCITGTPATSNTTTMVVNPLLPVSVSIAPDQNNVCQGTTVVMTATPVNGGATPLYQWYRNGTPVGSNQATYTFVPNNNDQVYVVLTSNATCATGNPATSNTVTMITSPGAAAGVTIVAGSNDVCEGTEVVFTAFPVNGGTPDYQWYVNGSATGPNSFSFSYFPEDGDEVYVVMTSSLVCVSNNPATSNTVEMIVNPTVTVTAVIEAEDNGVCAGEEMMFSAETTNGGNVPAYQWQVNGIAAGDDSPEFTYVPADGDVVNLVFTSSLFCTVQNPVTSNSITAEVFDLPAVTWESYEYPLMCVNWPDMELSGGSPEGGVYSGTGVENNLFSPSTVGAGSYTVTYTYTDENGCSGSAEFTIVVDECVGTTDPQSAAASMTIYPNPVENRLFVKMTNMPQISSMRIINGTGSVVLESNRIDYITGNGIEVRNLKPGLYTLQAIHSNGIVSRTFVVR